MTSQKTSQTSDEAAPAVVRPAPKARPSSIKRAFRTILKAIELGYRIEGLAAALHERAERTKVTDEQDAAARDREVWRQEQFDALDEIDAEMPKVMRLINDARSIPGLKKRRKAMRPLNTRLNKLGDDRLATLQALAQRDEDERSKARITELAQLEALRGGQVLIEEVDVDTPLVENGAEVWRNGERVKVREHLVRPIVTSRDGLETLATMHLTMDGRVRRNRDGTPMLPAISEMCHAAGVRYRDLYELCDPEGVLHAVNPEDMGRGQPPRDAFSSRVVAAIQDRAQFSGVIRRLEARVREELGEEGVYVLVEVAAKGNTIRSLSPGRRRAIRLTLKLREALGILAEAFGLM
ncbi:MAG: hypothetical protein HY859_06895 [Caulobacterales bacterium]|nr:hypothetical protein [Caulobacterales bacterium]